jgi:hypothetical protein
MPHNDLKMSKKNCIFSAFLVKKDMHWIEFSIDFRKLVKNPKNAGGECVHWIEFSIDFWKLVKNHNYIRHMLKPLNFYSISTIVMWI